MIALVEPVALAITAVVAVVASVPTASRWLRVAQREHYIPSWTTRLARLWYARQPVNLAVAAVAVALAVVAAFAPQVHALAYAGVVAAAVAAFVPLGLPVRGTSSPLAPTPRLRRLLGVWIVLMLLVAALLTLAVGTGGPAIALLLAPLVTDAALGVMRPVEKRLQRRFLVSARERLARVRPKIVAITGSYGKTSTKNYVAQVLDGSFSVIASPASFNNLMGLSRAVNDRVVPGTDVFVAEMGVYGEGEIRELSQSFPPDIAAITTIGEAHLQRMGSRAAIARAKSEITERAATVVLPVDEPELVALVERCRAEGKRVVTVSVRAEADADVVVDAATGRVSVRGAAGERQTATLELPPAGHAVNVAVTIGIAVALGLSLDAVAPRLAGLRGAQHRAEIVHADSGAAVIDDTYNANPVGAATAVATAADLARTRGGELVVVSPGMIELGPVQAERNRAFAAAIAAEGGHLLVLGRTNRRALLEGASGGRHAPRALADRPTAVAAALEIAGERGVILYENDIPDHYP